MAKAEAKRPSISSRLQFIEMQRAYYIFALIYFPVAWLFLGRGLIENSILGIYTVVLAIWGLVLIGGFLARFKTHSDSKSGNYGSLFAGYLSTGLIPLIMLKVNGFIFMSVLPLDKHQGLVCDFVRLAKNFYWHIFNYQHTLDIVILVATASFFAMALWNVGRSK